jgi:hypothetical protein
MNGRCVRASVVLDSLPPGRAPWRLAHRSRSLLYRFRTGTSAEILAGATLELDVRSEIAPGDNFTGRLDFWAEEVAPFLRAGEPFDVWYDGKVGHGEILGPCDDGE